MAQLPRALGLQHKRLTIKDSGDFAYDPVKVSKDSWLGRNYLYLQFFLLFLGLNVRLLFVNSDGFALGLYLVSTIFLAMAVNYWYGGKSWCHYVCPMAPVQMIYTGPRGLLGSRAHQEKKSLTQSMCRTVDAKGKEKSACVGCKATCLDIDIEKSYWEELHQPDKKLLYYGYFGLVIGFYLYFYLYSGSFDFLVTGAWTETAQLSTLLNPGFYLGGQVIAIPKLLAVPLTLSTSTGLSYGLGMLVERVYKQMAKTSHRAQVQRRMLSMFTQVQHRILTLCTFLSFNAIFFLGIYPSMSWLSLPVQKASTWLVVIASAAWFYRTWKRSAEQYTRESRVNNLRRSLEQLAIDFPKVLEGRSLEELEADEVYVLSKILPELLKDKDLLEEALAQKDADFSAQREMLEKMSAVVERRQGKGAMLQLPAPAEEPEPEAAERRSTKSVEVYEALDVEQVEREYVYLEAIVSELLGPIGPMLLRHTALQSSSFQELVQRMNAHIPLHHLAEFQRRTILLLQKPTAQRARQARSVLEHFTQT